MDPRLSKGAGCFRTRGVTWLHGAMQHIALAMYSPRSESPQKDCCARQPQRVAERALGDPASRAAATRPRTARTCAGAGQVVLVVQKHHGGDARLGLALRRTPGPTRHALFNGRATERTRAAPHWVGNTPSPQNRHTGQLLVAFGGKQKFVTPIVDIY